MMSCENDIEQVKLVTGNVKVRIAAGEMNRYLQPKPITEMPKGVKIDFFDDNLKVTSTLTSDYAVRDDFNKNMEAKKKCGGGEC